MLTSGPECEGGRQKEDLLRSTERWSRHAAVERLIYGTEETGFGDGFRAGGREGRVKLSARVSEWGELKRLTAESAEAHRVKVMADFGMKWLVFQGRDLSAGCC